MAKDVIDKRAARELIESIAENFLASGDLTDEDLLDFNTLADKISKLTRKYEFIPIIDHTDVILNAAHDFHHSGELDLAITMYAIYFEHTLNSIINHALIDRKISKKSKNELIRAVNIRGKCGWVLELLELPPIKYDHAKLINELSDIRNAFVHYKWNPEDSDQSSVEKKKTEILERSIKTVSYMKKYVSKIKYKGKKGSIKKALTKPSAGRAKGARR